MCDVGHFKEVAAHLLESSLGTWSSCSGLNVWNTRSMSSLFTSSRVAGFHWNVINKLKSSTQAIRRRHIGKVRIEREKETLGVLSLSMLRALIPCKKSNWKWQWASWRIKAMAVLTRSLYLINIPINNRSENVHCKSEFLHQTFRQTLFPTLSDLKS